MKSPKRSLLSKSRIVYFIDEYKSNSNYRNDRVFSVAGIRRGRPEIRVLRDILDRYDSGEYAFMDFR